MSALTLVPRGCNENMISAIRNLVCPLCGASMMGFRCLGLCRTDWQVEWDLAMSVTSKSLALGQTLRATSGTQTKRAATFAGEHSQGPLITSG